MTVDPAHAAGHEDYQGRTYYFCSENCLARFRQNPQSFSSPEPTAQEPAVTAGTEWTCPMHPEVRRDGPGSCPICGMALEPRVAAPEAGNPELDDMTWRLRVSALLTIPAVLLAMGEFVPGHVIERLAAPGALNWIQAALTTPVVLWGGWPFFVRGWQSVVNRSLNMFTLIALGVGVAYLDSVAATLFPSLFPPRSG